MLYLISINGEYSVVDKLPTDKSYVLITEFEKPVEHVYEVKRKTTKKKEVQ